MTMNTIGRVVNYTLCINQAHKYEIALLPKIVLLGVVKKKYSSTGKRNGCTGCSQCNSDLRTFCWYFTLLDKFGDLKRFFEIWPL